ncbi:hypothetical protein ETB97_001537 [Aspergillus alliaceus]|uniref:Uncharacterized protein n=1 Tax=Petromyces alliaceus TaxID=209559 RepID=A0A8H6ACB8_PETAA|nr:hypothetical protein ETB97_001537 [Aspergillus burnettii]
MKQDELLPLLAVTTVDNLDPILTIVAFIFLFCTLIIVLAKMVIIAVARSILVQFAVNYGLGELVASRAPVDIDRYDQFTHTAQLLHVLVIALSQVSVARLLYHLAPRRQVRQASNAMTTAVSA